MRPPIPHLLPVLGLILPISCAAVPGGQGVDTGPYRDEAALEAALRGLVAGSSGAATLSSIGVSRSGRPIHLLRLAAESSVPPDERPAVLVVAGQQGTHLLGTEVAVEAARALLSERGKDPAVEHLLADAVLYIVPRASPDASRARFERPLAERRGNLRPVDDDRDGRVDEDGPDDLDGDGEILKMRIEDPEGTMVADDVDPRILRPADPLKGERGRWKLEPEGTDEDGDGKRNEDPPGDARPDRNFPQGHPEHDPDAGAHAASEPETRSLLEFCLSHRNVAAVLVYGRQDNLVQSPGDGDAQAGEVRGLSTKIPKGDLPILKEVGERYREVTGSKAKGEKADEGGTFPAWAALQFGVPTLAATLWRPDLENLPPASAPASAPATAPASGPASKPAGKDEALEEERKRLRWNDAVLGGSGFVGWHAVPYPRGLRVEVGGWRPYVLENPAPAEVAPIAEKQARFLVALADFLPRVKVAEARVEARGGDLFSIEATVENAGRFPTATEMGRRTGKVRPVRVRLEVPEGAAILAGEKQTLVPVLPGGGGRQELRWIVRAPAGSSARLEVSTDRSGADAREIRFEGGTPR
ncbi:MAG TPA: M14 family zinc carboxypeptidase [Planctomycetota bacterium]|nr:M14 family zinc carboxypeptidase [Planctomycetota bacterium]